MNCLHCLLDLCLVGPGLRYKHHIKLFWNIHSTQSPLSLPSFCASPDELVPPTCRDSMTHISIQIPEGENKTTLNNKRKRMARSWRLYMADNETSSIVADSWKAHQEQSLTWFQKICNRKLQPEGTVLTSNSQARKAERGQTEIIE